MFCHMVRSFNGQNFKKFLMFNFCKIWFFEKIAVFAQFCTFYNFSQLSAWEIIWKIFWLFFGSLVFDCGIFRKIYRCNSENLPPEKTFPPGQFSPEKIFPQWQKFSPPEDFRWKKFGKILPPADFCWKKSSLRRIFATKNLPPGRFLPLKIFHEEDFSSKNLPFREITDILGTKKEDKLRHFSEYWVFLYKLFFDSKLKKAFPNALFHRRAQRRNWFWKKKSSSASGAQIFENQNQNKKLTAGIAKWCVKRAELFRPEVEPVNSTKENQFQNRNCSTFNLHIKTKCRVLQRTVLIFHMANTKKPCTIICSKNIPFTPLSTSLKFIFGGSVVVTREEGLKSQKCSL